MYLLKVATVRPENDGASAMEMGVTGSKQELVDDDDGELEDENNDAAEPVKEEVQKKKKIIERKKLDEVSCFSLRCIKKNISTQKVTFKFSNCTMGRRLF
jgi:hypothetical protein